VLYSLLIAPSRDYGDLERTFDHMVHSLRVDDRAATAEESPGGDGGVR